MICTRNDLAALFPMLDAQALDRLEQLPDMYQAWNAKVNLISRKDVEHLMLHHIVHSLALCLLAPLPSSAQVLDFGTGGGFPGIPLAIAYPQVSFHLVDSIGKKVRIVEDIAAEIPRHPAQSSQIRGETLTERYTHVVARAVAPLDQLWRWAKPLLRRMTDATAEGQGLYAYKGGAVRLEAAPFGNRPQLWPLIDVLHDPYFDEKYLVYIPSVS